MSDKFDEFEKERQEQKKVIEELWGEVRSLNEKLNGITEQVDWQEQYSRQNSLLIHGITEENQENTDDLQSWPKYMRQTLVFVWNSALWEKFNFNFWTAFCLYWQNFHFGRKTGH